LINDLLDITRIAAGNLKLNLQPTDIGSLLKAVGERFQPTASQQHIALSISVDNELANVHADPDRLVQVLDNLISNALKFTPKGGRVDLRLERRADQLLISISDSGEGIAPEVLPHVFDEFIRIQALRRGRGLAWDSR
jgi:signal transduction histidine kinase